MTRSWLEHQLDSRPEVLRDLLGVREFRKYGFRRAQHGLITDFFLMCGGGKGFHFSVAMMDLSERLEVGRMRLDTCGEGPSADVTLVLPESLQETLEVQKLVLNVAGYKVESGLKFIAPGHCELILVSGAYPHTVAVGARPQLPLVDVFQPEYRIDTYTTERLAPALPRQHD